MTSVEDTYGSIAASNTTTKSSATRKHVLGALLGVGLLAFSIVALTDDQKAGYKGYRMVATGEQLGGQGVAGLNDAILEEGTTATPGYRADNSVSQPNEVRGPNSVPVVASPPDAWYKQRETGSFMAKDPALYIKGGNPANTRQIPNTPAAPPVPGTPAVPPTPPVPGTPAVPPTPPVPGVAGLGLVGTHYGTPANPGGRVDNSVSVPNEWREPNTAVTSDPNSYWNSEVGYYAAKDPSPPKDQQPAYSLINILGAAMLGFLAGAVTGFGLKTKHDYVARNDRTEPLLRKEASLV